MNNHQHYALNYRTSLFNGVLLTWVTQRTEPQHSGTQVTQTLYDIPPICSSNSHGSKKLPDDGRLLPEHVGALSLNKEVI
jgi:hypothetical protein